MLFVAALANVAVLRPNISAIPSGMVKSNENSTEVLMGKSKRLIPASQLTLHNPVEA